MKKFLSSQFLLASLLSLAVLTARADDEQAQFDILHSPASVSQKWKACQRLRVIGTVKAVAEVAPLLADPQLSQAARQTLDGLPYPEVDDALRDALGKTTGLLKAGIIDSIGWREKPASASLLTPLLSDTDTNIAAAAATSLGRIGGTEAIAALSAAQPPSPAVQASLLECAERLANNNDQAGAAAIYRNLNDDKYPLGIRTAAWSGLVLTDPAHQAELMEKALEGTDRPLELVALKVLRDSNDPNLIQACVGQWASFPAEAQLAVIDAAVKQGNEALPIVRLASQSSLPTLRVAAWSAMGELNDLTSIPALAQAAASGKKAEREAARESLARLRGPGVSEALLAVLDKAATPEKAELLRALGSRQDAKVTDVLLQNAAAGDELVRLAALQSLTEIAPPEALSPLLEIAEKADADDVRDAAVEALSAVCQTSPDKESATRAVVEAEEKLPPAAQGAFLPLLPQLGTADALAAAQSASQSQNLELAKAAVRALSQWPNAAPADSLLDLAGKAADPALQTLAVRGAIAASATESSVNKHLQILKQAMAEARRPDEKKEALSQLGQIPAPESLELALNAMTDPDISNEAALAVISIAEKLAPSDPQLAGAAAAKVLQQHKEGELFQRAWALRIKSGKDIPFIRDWVMCGPYSRAGLIGAKAFFNIRFGPETRNKSVEWKPVPSGDQVDLAGLFPGRDNCVAYLRTTILAPEDCPAVLLMGSDDGIKAWLNGVVVHRNNVDRAEVADQDVASIKLKKGENELILKITQGGGGWGACARIVSADGSSIPGLQIQRPTGAASKLISAK